MDIDAFVAVRQNRWDRLRALNGNRRLTGAQADEMMALYRSAASDLSVVRSTAPEPGLVTRLSILLANSRVWLTGAHTFSLRDVGLYFTRDLPAALYRVRWWSVITALCVVVLAAFAAVHTVNSPEALDLVGDPQTRAQIAQVEFQNYYVEYDSTTFAAQVWTNNWWLCVQVLLFGITGFVPLILLYNTTLQLGVAAAVMAEHGLLDVFFKSIIPHGLLELSALFVASGAGLRLFWTMLVPGGRSRGRALAEEGRGAIGVAVGLIITLFISGLIEGYVTGSNLIGWEVKIAIGVLAFSAFWFYVFFVGRRATRGGATGDAQGDFAVASAPLAA